MSAKAGVEEANDRMKAKLAQALTGVEGWLELPVAWMLHELTRCLSVSRGPVNVVEIGCWKGRSTIALALGLRVRGGGLVFAIDPHTGSEQTLAMYGAIDTWTAFLENIKAAGVERFVKPLRTTSHQARPRFADGSVHFVLIDGSREYPEFLEYIDDWQTALAEGGILAVRGPFEPNVYRVLRERVLGPDCPFRKPTYVYESSGEILLVEHQTQPVPWTLGDRRALLVLGAQHTIRSTARRLRRLLPPAVRGRAKRLVERLIRVLGSVICGGSGRVAQS